MNRYVVAITGASGAALGLRVLEAIAARSEVHLIMSPESMGIMMEETGLDLSAPDPAGVLRKICQRVKGPSINYWDSRDMAAPVSSGSFQTDGMIVAPCSMKTLSGIASGYAENLVQRAADVTIKEGRTLVLAPREMPFSAIHLENMLKLSRIGVRIAPPVPAFYQGPKTLDEMIDFLAGKLLDALGVEHSLYKRWEGRA
ncbi:UbiX family flavin prenyltransferase [Nitrospirota bacterium]